MRFALLGGDDESVCLAEAAVELGHKLTWFADVPGKVAGRLASLAGEQPGTHWEVLMDHDFCDGVILGRGSAGEEMRAEQLIQLAKNGVAVLAAFPLIDSVLAYYEIDMARAESGAVLHHFNPLLEQQPILDTCAAWVSDGHPQLGRVEQIVWERPLAERSRPRVLRQFARDVELLSRVGGRLDKLGALGSPKEDSTYAGLSVQLLGASQVPVRWSVGPGSDREAPRLELVAEQGSVVVDFEVSEPNHGLVHRLETMPGETSTSTSTQAVPAARAALERFADAVEKRGGPSSTWPAALLAMELADTIEISLRRGRMIDIHPQQLTEQLAFKGTMSALSCGVLVVLVPCLLALGWLAGQLGIPVAKYWPHVLLPMLALFLLLQLVPKFFLTPLQSESRGRDGGAKGQ
ncbi:MAG: hypothetical protein MK171_04925 [Pirellulales bacterium]|nr:hypothetical protein [Pirellulales bacterium]